MIALAVCLSVVLQGLLVPLHLAQHDHGHAGSTGHVHRAHGHDAHAGGSSAHLHPHPHDHGHGHRHDPAPHHEAPAFEHADDFGQPMRAPSPTSKLALGIVPEAAPRGAGLPLLAHREDLASAPWTPPPKRAAAPRAPPCHV